MAFNLLQIEYSQEARPYSMLVCGSALSTLFWYRSIASPSQEVPPSWLYIAAYIILTGLTFHAHYLVALVVLGHLAWWLILLRASNKTAFARRETPLPHSRVSVLLAALSLRSTSCRAVRPLIALASIAVLCVPIVLRYLCFRTLIFQGLDWIEPPTAGDAFEVLEQLTFGRAWVVGILSPAIVLWLAAIFHSRRPSVGTWARRIFLGPDDLCGLLLTCFVTVWFGLLLISWVVHPAMVARYALPAAIPALLLPLLVVHRLDRRLPWILFVLFGAVGLRDWVLHGREAEPGFRELSAYLAEHVDPKRDAIVLTIDLPTHAEWADAERLSFQYYPVRDYPILELQSAPDGRSPRNPEVFRDPRAMYLVVFRADPFEILANAARTAEPFWIDGAAYSQLLFSPYRLARVAPLK
jgi:hypothetical protein